MNSLQAVGEAIQMLAKDFQDAPFDYLYESDVRSRLYAGIFDRMRTEPLSIESRGVRKDDPTRSVTINPVKSEYPSGTRFDIAIINGPGDSNRRIWNHRVNIAIEIKLWQVDGTGGSVRYDLSKLAQYRFDRKDGRPFLGLSLLFCHPGVQYDAYLHEYLPLLKPTNHFVEQEDGLALHVISATEGWSSAWVDQLHAL